MDEQTTVLVLLALVGLYLLPPTRWVARLILLLAGVLIALLFASEPSLD